MFPNGWFSNGWFPFQWWPHVGGSLPSYVFSCSALSLSRGPVNSKKLELRVGENAYQLALTVSDDDFSGSSAVLVLEQVDSQGNPITPVFPFTGQGAQVNALGSSSIQFVYVWPAPMPAVRPGDYEAYFLVTRSNGRIWTSPSVAILFLSD